MIDPNEVSDETLELAPEKLAEMMGVVYRTAYKHITKNKWKRIEGYQGTVKYVVPKSYIDHYLETMKKEVDERTGQGTVINSSLNGEKPDLSPVMNYENDRLKNEEIEALREESLNLREELYKSKLDGEFFQKQAEEREKALLARLDAKDEIITGLKDRIIQFEKQIAGFDNQLETKDKLYEVTKNELENANTALKRRQETLPDVRKEDISAGKTAIELEEYKNKTESLEKKVQELEQKGFKWPWKK